MSSCVKIRWVKFDRGVVPREEFDKHLPAHLEYVKSLQRAGRWIEDGYWGELGGGMMIFDAADEAEARRIIANDPLVKAGVVEYDLKEWRVVVGMEK